ncbi:MAG: hypothetical protein AAFO74_09435 [Pseudomonadota bacterium]
MRILLFVSTLAVAAACSPTETEVAPPVADATIAAADKTDIECLSAKTVTKITETIRDGAAAGIDPAELRDVPAVETAKAVEQLQTKYSQDAHATLLKSDVNYRLEVIQNAINNRNPESDAHQVMNDTFERAAGCTFGS